MKITLVTLLCILTLFSSDSVLGQNLAFEQFIKEPPIGSYEIIIPSLKSIPKSLPEELQFEIQQRRQIESHNEYSNDTLTILIMSQQAYDSGLRWLPYSLRKEETE